MKKPHRKPSLTTPWTSHDGDVKYYSYDQRGNLTEMRSEGNVFNTYAFDAANQLIEVTNKFGDTSSYTYDGLGNRIQTIIDLNHGCYRRLYRARELLYTN